MKKTDNIKKLRSCLNKPCEESLVQILDLLHFEIDESKRNVMQEYALDQLRDWPLHQYYDYRDTGDPDSLADVHFDQDVWTPESLISLALQENYRYLGIFQIESFEDYRCDDYWNFFVNDSWALSYTRMKKQFSTPDTISQIYFGEGSWIVKELNTLQLTESNHSCWPVLEPEIIDFALHKHLYLPQIFIDQLDDFSRRSLSQIKTNRISPFTSKYRKLYNEITIEYFNSLGF